jgi:cytolysin-activating lysine-acyltransferase
MASASPPKIADSNGQRHAEALGGAAAEKGVPSLASAPLTRPVPGGQNRTFSQVFGEIAWLLTQSPSHKTFFLSDLEWMVMQPILLEQFRIFYDDKKPIGVAFWAFANDEVAGRLAQGGARLRPDDWKSGTTPWLVEIVTPYTGAVALKFNEILFADLKRHVFPDRPLSVRVLKDGKSSVRVV